MHGTEQQQQTKCRLFDVSFAFYSPMRMLFRLSVVQQRLIFHILVFRLCCVCMRVCGVFSTHWGSVKHLKRNLHSAREFYHSMFLANLTEHGNSETRTLGGRCPWPFDIAISMSALFHRCSCFSFIITIECFVISSSSLSQLFLVNRFGQLYAYTYPSRWLVSHLRSEFF